jgi:hypothetical protein
VGERSTVIVSVAPDLEVTISEELRERGYFVLCVEDAMVGAALSMVQVDVLVTDHEVALPARQPGTQIVIIGADPVLVGVVGDEVGLAVARMHPRR